MPEVRKFAPERRETEEPKRRWKEIERSQHLKFEVTDDFDEAREIVAGLIARGEKALITIPDRWIDRVRKTGIPVISQQDKLTGQEYAVTAARLGGDPYFAAGEERHVAEVDLAGLSIEPRMTGPDKAFYGTVAFPKGIPADRIFILGRFGTEQWSRRDEAKKQNAA